MHNSLLRKSRGEGWLSGEGGGTYRGRASEIKWLETDQSFLETYKGKTQERRNRLVHVIQKYGGGFYKLSHGRLSHCGKERGRGEGGD